MIKQARIPTAVHYTHQSVITEDFQFSHLARKNLLADPAALEKLQQRTGLADLYWQTLYYKSPIREETLAEALLEADGYVFFLHGWNGSHLIWENLPFQLTAKHKRIVCFNLDVNGFGRSPFINDPPAAEQCSPVGLMAAVEHWLSAIGLWPATRREQKPFYLFVGHSMGGAALFYKDEIGWRDEAYGFYALAPALLCNDTQRQNFYKTLGTGIRLPSFTAVKNALAPHVIDLLGTGASPAVKNEHLRVFAQTPFGTTAQTFYVMGARVIKPRRTDWHRFRAALGHRDRLVGLDPMRKLLKEFNFQSNQIRIMPGDHYFFSYGNGSPATHKDNRQTVLNDLLDYCQKLTKEAKKLRTGVRKKRWRLFPSGQVRS